MILLINSERQQFIVTSGGQGLAESRWGLLSNGQSLVGEDKHSGDG